LAALDSTNIPSPGERNNRGSRDSGAPSRGDLEASPCRIFHQGGPTKADLLEVELPDGAVIVKDFSGKRWWVRWLGRLQIRREYRAYRWLGAIRGIPRLLGLVDAHALAIEKVEGEQLALAGNRYTEADSHLRRLRECLDRIHDAGVAHMDFRGRENVLVRPDGQIVVVDFAGAVCLRPGGLAHRILFRWLVIPDETGYLKWKVLLRPDSITPEEKRFIEKTGRLRKLWIFNPKKRKPDS
jgi:hypothetical protein